MPYKDKEKQREAQRKWEKENRGAGKRHKVWMFIFYPDTAEVGWRGNCGPHQKARAEKCADDHKGAQTRFGGLGA